MWRSLPLFLIAVSCAFSQKSPPPAGLVEVKPDTVIAVINGRKLTVGEFERMLPAWQQNLQRLVSSQPKTGLQEFALVDLLSREAEKLKIDQDPKVQEKLAESRRQVLAAGLIQRQAEITKVPEEELRKYYQANMDALREAQVRIVFISRANVTQTLKTGEVSKEDPEVLKQKAADVAKQARTGKDFAELAKQYSDDKDTGANGGVLNLKITSGMTNLPKEMTDPILKASAGDIVGPVEHETGWYLFKVETNGVPEFEAARSGMEKQLKEARLRTWYEQLRGKASVQMENDVFWETFVATNKKDGAAPGGSK